MREHAEPDRYDGEDFFAVLTKLIVKEQSGNLSAEGLRGLRGASPHPALLLTAE
jgi:hypothetical protein